MHHLILLGVVTIVSVSAQERLGSISGTVLATSARSVGGLQVAYVALPPVNHSAPKTAARTTTSPNGAFTLNAVAAGAIDMRAGSCHGRRARPVRLVTEAFDRDLITGTERDRTNHPVAECYFVADRHRRSYRIDRSQ